MERLQPDELARFAAETARQAGRMVLEMQGRVETELKAPQDVVTEADRRSEAFIIDRILERYPGHGIVAEEGGGREGRGRYVWYIDPIDGTTNYTQQMPLYCVSIAAVADGRVEAGAVYAPALDQLFVAARGGGLTLNGRPAGVSRCGAIEDAVLSVDFPFGKKKGNWRFKELRLPARGLRHIGAAALELAYVAAGLFDSYWETNLKPFDVAAGILLVEEGGGRVTDGEGGPPSLAGGEILATNGLLHDRLLEALAASRRATAAGGGADVGH